MCHAGLCFLLHEPQLKASVPVNCVGAVLAFVTCTSNPEPLCRAALDLVMVLHARLDVMVPKEEWRDGPDGEAGSQARSQLIHSQLSPR